MAVFLEKGRIGVNAVVIQYWRIINFHTRWLFIIVFWFICLPGLEAWEGGTFNILGKAGLVGEIGIARFLLSTIAGWVDFLVCWVVGRLGSGVLCVSCLYIILWVGGFCRLRCV